ncbi:20925_t:CDS:1, partial [Rhizophagus irregularis]
LFPPPQSHTEAPSSSDDYLAADSDSKDSAELINSPSPPLRIVQLDIFNKISSTPHMIRVGGRNLMVSDRQFFIFRNYRPPF